MSKYVWDYAYEWAHIVDVVKLRPWSNVAFEKNWPSKHYTPVEADAAWGAWPELNVGAIAWPHYWVLDLDGPVAVAFFEELCGKNGESRRINDLTLTVATPGRGGGLHLWWVTPQLEQGKRLTEYVQGCEHAEVKHGPSRYTAVPPSIRPEGRYRFVSGNIEPQPTPPWLTALIVRDGTPYGATSSEMGGLAELAGGDGRWADCARIVVEGTVADAVEAVLTARVGARNTTLYSATHRVCEIGAFDRLQDLRAAAMRAGLSEHEVDAAIASAASNYTRSTT